MAITNQERVGKALQLLNAGLGPFIERELANAFGSGAQAEAVRLLGEDRIQASKPAAQWDSAALLRVLWDGWHEVFKTTLGQAERTHVSELRDVRNRWAHQQPFTTDDAYRALDTVGRLLAAVSAPQADELEKMKNELLRVRFEEQLRTERRKTTGTAIETQASPGLKPWREVVTPHQDVASGRYQQAEFAADLWQVRLGEGSDEYRDPKEFFRRTYLTESLSRLLVGALQRLAGQGGDPVVQLQTNFGGGKTHSMLALYHMVSGVALGELPGLDALVKEAGVTSLPEVKRVVLVGNRISPGNPVTKPDGTVVRTLWGELAWQLDGRQAYERLRADDEQATCPGDVLRELLLEHSPCLILVDEWVAYARQLHDESDLPGGSSGTQFTFAQAFTETVKLAPRCMLVVSLPASDSPTSPHAQADDVEVGGLRGRAALEQLRNAVGRVEASWRPASAEEGFEIVRRRLFEPLVEKEHFVARDATARAFYELYRTQHQEFPPECRDAEYERRLKAAYPIHPEVFDRLYGDWSTLVKFQRTRGVLRLMAAVIHCLWDKGDKNPLILPANLAIDDPRVQFELTRYLSDNWVPVLEKDVDGAAALPARIDGEVPNLGKYHACRRVARTIYLGSAPTATAANRGIEDRRIKLGCVMPGESPAVFGDALRRLAAAATYLYQDGVRYWFSTQPTVTKLAEDRAEQLRREPDKVTAEIEARLKADLHARGGFDRVHVAPQSGADVSDGMEARLVVLGPEQPYTKEPGSKAEVQAKVILQSRGSAPRLFQNTLVFLAADQARLQDLDDAVRRALAWRSIVAESQTLDLSPHQVKQAEIQEKAADAIVDMRLPEAYQWLLVPVQPKPGDPIGWDALRLSGQDHLAERAFKRLKSSEALITVLAGTNLRLELDKIPLWRGDHVALKQLCEDFARYVYLPRVASPDVLAVAVHDGLSRLLWMNETFAWADSYDETAGRYRGLRCGQAPSAVDSGSSGLLVKPEVALRQQEEEVLPPPPPPPPPGPNGGKGPDAGGGSVVKPPVVVRARRFHGSVQLNPTRAGADAGRIAEEVIAHLNGLVGATVTVTLDIAADVPSGAPDHVVRTVTENARTLKFTSAGFEEE